MIRLLKKFITAIPVLKKFALFFIKKIYQKKYSLTFGKNVYINLSTICEGRNFFSDNSYVVNSKIGFGSYIGANTKILKTKIGRYCSIGPNVRCILGKHPTSKFVSTHPSFFSTLRQAGFSYTDKQLFEEHPPSYYQEGKYTICIGNDVWIGDGAALMEGVKIGDGAVIAANSLVTKDVAAYDIVGGLPSKHIKSRFSREQVKFLLQFRWWDKSQEWLKANASKFQDIDEFCNSFRGV